MRTDSFEIANTTHWVQEANEPGNCPLKRDDTRITVIPVQPLSQEAREQYPKKKLLKLLNDEAPHFLRTLLDLELPPVTDRLRLEVVETEDKRQLEDDHDPEAVFLREHCEVKTGSRLGKKAVWDRYNHWAVENGHDPLKHKSFGWAVMRVFAGQIKNTDKLLGDSGLPCYTHLAWKEGVK